MQELETLRSELAQVKSANPLMKAAPAERALDAALACLVSIDQRLSQLEERAGQQYGERTQ